MTGALAESWEMLDPLTYVFHIREGGSLGVVMSFAVADIEDLTRLLEEQPGSCARLRRLLLSGEPPDSQEDPAALRRDTDRRLDRFAAALERSGQEFDRRIAEMTARMDGTDQRFAE